jgi:hypothetical protein
MKILFLIMLLLFSVAAEAFVIKDGAEETMIDLSKLQEYERIELTTEREKRGEIIIDHWQGIPLRDILPSHGLDSFDQLVFTSSDNYRIRLTAEEIGNYDPIIALNRNDSELAEDKIRLVVPGMRDMFWIDGIMTIETETYRELPLPDFIFFAEDLLSGMEIVTDPKPFRKVEGFFFFDLIAQVYPSHKEEFFLAGRDGVAHRLDFDTYLRNAVLVSDEEGIHLRSPDMPAGMWIKSLAYIQMMDRAIIFRNEFANLSEVKELRNWDKIPDTLLTTGRESLSTDIDFSDPVWRGAGLLRWQK